MTKKNKFKKNDFVKFEVQSEGKIEKKIGKISGKLTQSVHSGEKINTYYMIDGVAIIEDSITEKLPNLDDCYYLDDDHSCLAIRKGKLHTWLFGFTVDQNEKPSALLEMTIEERGIGIRPQPIRHFSDDFFEILKQFNKEKDKIITKHLEEKKQKKENALKTIANCLRILSE